MTGATSGLGLDTITQLSKQPNTKIIIGARNPEKARQLEAVAHNNRIRVLPLDLASLDSVRHFVSAVKALLRNQRLTSVGLNAGIQITTGLERTKEGYERTFVSNYLGHFLLVHLLLPVLAKNAVVVSTASGTHDPQDFISGKFGFRGGLFPGVEAIAQGILDESVSDKQQCLDRYATSKLCLILFTYEMARRVPAHQARFTAFDPGLMPGTKLARDRDSIERFAWNYVLPLLSWFIPGVSRSQGSARALAQLLTRPFIDTHTGQHFDYELRLTQTSADSHRKDWQQELYDTSIKLSGAEKENG